MEENIKKCIHNHNKDYSLSDSLNSSNISKVKNKDKTNISSTCNNNLNSSFNHNNTLTYS